MRERGGEERCAIPMGDTVKWVQLMRFLDTLGAEGWVAKAVVALPGNTPGSAHRKAHHAIHALGWSLTCNNETVNIIPISKILSLVIILSL